MLNLTKKKKTEKIKMSSQIEQASGCQKLGIHEMSEGIQKIRTSSYKNEYVTAMQCTV